MVMVVLLYRRFAAFAVTVGNATAAPIVATWTGLPLLRPLTVTTVLRAVPTFPMPSPLRLTVRLVAVAEVAIPVTPPSKVTMSLAAVVEKLVPVMMMLGELTGRLAVFSVTVG